MQETDVEEINDEAPVPTRRRGLMLLVLGGLTVVIAGVVVLLATAPPSPEPDAIIPDEWIISERSRFFLWGQRLVEVKNPAQDVVHAYFVNHESPELSLSKAEDCARTELARFTTATCYAFLSEEAFEFAGIPSQGGEPEVACWIAAATATRSSSGDISTESRDNPEIDPACPV